MQIDRARRMTRFGRIIARYDAGEPVDQIADDYECHRSTVLRNARMAGLEKRAKGFPERIRKAVITLYKESVPIAEIAARLGVSQAYISKTATEEKINRRKFAKKKP